MSQLTLGDIATHARTVLDVDSTELPDSLFDVWAREITNHIQLANERWPFREASWSLTTTGDIAAYDYDDISTAGSTLGSVVSVVDADGVSLGWVSYDEAERLQYADTTPTSDRLFSVWGESVIIYPTPTTAETMTVRGFRKPNDWVADGSGGVPDFPDQFDGPVMNWCLGRAHWQQDDPENGQPLMDLAESQIKELVAKYPGKAPMAQPLRVGGKRRRSIGGRLAYSWE